MVLTAPQKALVKQYISVTNSGKREAEAALKAQNWNLQGAIDTFYSAAHATTSKATTTALNKVFDAHRDDPTNSPDTIEMTGAMAYFKAVGIDIENVSLLVASEFLGCPSLGEIPRTGFLAAWGPLSATSIAAQNTHLQALTREFSTPAARAQGGLYRRVYKHTFRLACPAGSKSVPVDSASEFWKMLFGPGAMPWVSADGSTPWLTLYLDYLNNKWKKAVNKDLWDQTLLFALKTLEDPSLAWWSVDSAWPGVIDDFMAWVKSSRGNGPDAMVVD